MKLDDFILGYKDENLTKHFQYFNSKVLKYAFLMLLNLFYSFVLVPLRNTKYKSNTSLKSVNSDDT